MFSNNFSLSVLFVYYVKLRIQSPHRVFPLGTRPCSNLPAMHLKLNASTHDEYHRILPT